jgi:hypothetical protein
MKKYIALFAVLLSACNAVNIKPRSLDKNQILYADRGGYSMKFAVKKELEDRGYKIKVGKYKGGLETEEFDLDISNLPKDARYVVSVKEKTPSFSPVICLFGGFNWWRFTVSIADQKTGEELLAWTGMGCANGALRRLNRLMDKLEKE